MPTTPNFALPYPGALDEPCDFAQDWCAFTDAAAAVLADFQATADRVYPVEPVAKMELNTVTTITRNSVVPFDSVTVKRQGRFIAVFDACMQTTFVANSRFLVDFDVAPSTLGQSQELDLATSSVAFCANAMYVTSTPPIDIYVVLDSTAAVATLEIQYASLAVYWHSDGVAP